MTTATKPIPVKSIKFTFSENIYFQRHHKGGYEVSNFHDADSFLLRLSHYCHELGYDKTDFVVEWEDGSKWSGRYDLHKYGHMQEHRNGSTPHLGQHIRDHMEVYSGRYVPSHLREKPDLLKRVLAVAGPDHGKMCAHFLDNYELP